jgi:acetolactate synthase small subunit
MLPLFKKWSICNKQHHNGATNVLTEAGCLCQNIGRHIVLLFMQSDHLKQRGSIAYCINAGRKRLAPNLDVAEALCELCFAAPDAFISDVLKKVKYDDIITITNTTIQPIARTRTAISII